MKKYRYQIQINLEGWEEGDDPEQTLEQLLGVFYNRAKSAKWLKTVASASLTTEGQGYVAWLEDGKVTT
jgi:hypothetical protein